MSTSDQEKVFIEGEKIPQELVPILDAPWEQVNTVREFLSNAAGKSHFKELIAHFMRSMSAGNFSEYLQERKEPL